MHINYRAQFADKTKSKRRKAAKKANPNAEPIDLDHCEEERQWQQQAGMTDDDMQDDRAGSADSAAEESASQQSPPEQRQCGRWAHHNNRNVSVKLPSIYVSLEQNCVDIIEIKQLLMVVAATASIVAWQDMLQLQNVLVMRTNGPVTVSLCDF